LGINSGDLVNVIIGHYYLNHTSGAYALVQEASVLNIYLHEAIADWLIDSEQFKCLVASSREGMGE
jgi:metal-dependent hydrolase (beta-lactamase superfamily II)